MLTLYTSPSGNFSYFFNTFQCILNTIHTNTLNITICGDININYLADDNTNKLKPDSLLATSSLFSIIDFPARINNISMAAIDNSFIDKYRNENFTINPLPNGLSDHYTQVLVLNNINIQNPSTYPIIRRNINKFTISEFKLHTRYES